MSSSFYQPEVAQLREVRNLFRVILVNYQKGEWEFSRNHGNHNVERERHTRHACCNCVAVLENRFFPPELPKRERERGTSLISPSSLFCSASVTGVPVCYPVCVHHATWRLFA